MNIDDDDHDEQTVDEQASDELADDQRAGDEQPEEETPEEQPEERLQKPRRNSFRKAGPKLTPEAAARQGEVTTLAFKVLGRDSAITFLNGHHEELAARPIDLAVDSAEGAARVTAVIEASRKA